MFSSPKDIALKKMEWHKMGGGDRHLRDIASILRIRGDTLDGDYISQHVSELGVETLWQTIQESTK
jgi:hypothetical protein